MKIQTLKDFKDAFKNVPDEVLEDFGFGWSSEGEEISMLCCDTENDPFQKYNELSEKYPQLLDIDKWLKNILKLKEKSDAQEIEDEYDEFISSEDKF